jgi:hypothetical protein
MDVDEEDLQQKPDRSAEVDVSETSTSINPSGMTIEQVEMEKGQEVLNTMLDSFQTFVEGKGDLEGVAHSTSEADELKPAEINPRIFMHLLHTVLKSSPEDLKNLELTTSAADDYFDEGDCEEGFEEDEEMVNIMVREQETGYCALQYASQRLKVDHYFVHFV